MNAAISSPDVKESPEQTIIRKKLQEMSSRGNSTDEKTIPGKPEELLRTIFRMKFKKGPVSQEVFFEFKDDQRLAETAAREYCGRFKLRFIWVEKFFVDITSQPIVEETEN